MTWIVYLAGVLGFALLGLGLWLAGACLVGRRQELTPPPRRVVLGRDAWIDPADIVGVVPLGAEPASERDIIFQIREDALSP